MYLSSDFSPGSSSLACHLTILKFHFLSRRRTGGWCIRGLEKERQEGMVAAQSPTALFVCLLYSSCFNLHFVRFFVLPHFWGIRGCHSCSKETEMGEIYFPIKHGKHEFTSLCFLRYCECGNRWGFYRGELAVGLASGVGIIGYVLRLTPQ